MKIDARKLSPQEQREKRSTALRMREQGYTYKAIGEAVGVHPRTIAHWAQVAEHINPAIKYTKSCCVGDTWMPEIRTDSLRA